MIQSHPVNTDSKGAIESVRITRVELRENVRAFFLQGQGKLSHIIKNRLRFGLQANRVNTDTKGAIESVRINEVSVKRGSTVTRIINNHGGGVQTVSLSKSTLSPDEDLEYAVEKSRSVVTILGQTINGIL